MNEVYPYKIVFMQDLVFFVLSLRPMSVAAGTYGTVGGGFIRVNGNPMDQPIGGVHSDKAPPGSPYPPSAPQSMVHNHVGPCSGATANRELQCILKELKFITNHMKIHDEELGTENLQEFFLYYVQYI